MDQESSGKLFSDGVVDRTDLRIASNNSACGGDVASYLTGARTRFASHVIDPKLTESMSTTATVLTAHLVMPSGNADGDAFLDRVAHELEERFGIAHATLQIEHGDGAECRLAADKVV